MSASRPISPEVEPIVDAFREVLGYRHAYLSGADAAAEYGWAIRNFTEVCADVREDTETAT